MTEEKMTRDQILDSAASDLAEFMYHLTTTYRGHEREIAGMLISSLGGYLSIVSKRPAEALANSAAILAGIDHVAIRAAHFGYQTLGVKDMTNLEPPKYNGVLGVARRKTDD